MSCDNRPRSYVTNCFIWPRVDQVGGMFWVEGDIVSAHLDRYAIVPREAFEGYEEFAELYAEKLARDAIFKAAGK